MLPRHTNTRRSSAGHLGGTPAGRARHALAFGLFVVLAALVFAAPIFAEAGSINSCLAPCHGGLGIAPDIATAYDAPDGGHRMNWSAKVVADTTGAQYTQGSRMPCDECHSPHGGATSSIYSFNEARTGGPITTIRQLCEGCHRPYDSSESTPTVCGLKLKKLPSSTSAHADASTQACSDCHGSTGHAPEGHGGGGGGACSDCHGNDGSHVVHTSATDPRGPGGLACADCHDTGNYPGFAAGSDTDLSGKIELDETTSCDGCHSPGGSYDGVDSAATPTGATSVGAKDVWDAGAYETSSTLRAGNEKWCAGCHDGDKSVGGQEPSLISGVYAAPVAGDEGGDYLYGTGWGYYETGHGLATDVALPSSGGMQMGAGLECDACHDYEKGHIDGNRWTYSSGGGSASYRDGFRLIQPDLGSGPIYPMLMPRTQTGGNSVLAPEAWALCASCHDSGPFVSGGTNDTNLFCSGTNQHRNHLSMNNVTYDSDHTGGADSRAICITCHNVHGSQYLAMMRDGTLLDLQPGMRMWYWNSSFSTWFGNNTTPPDPPNLTLVNSTGRARVGQPTFCGACHNHNYIDSPHDRGAPLFWAGDFPVLDWTWEEYYEGRGIPTDRVFNTTEAVAFRVKYYDPNNDAPSAVEVWIDHDDNGSYVASETATMVKDDPLDVDYTDGVIYETTVTVTDPGDKDLIYRFYAIEGTHTAAGQPAVDQTMTWDDNFMRDVPGEYASIQDAIDNAYDGNTILVGDGSYGENLDTLGKLLTLVSVNGSSTTSIVGSASTAQPVVTFASGAASGTIEGFVINNAYDSQTVNGARGVVIESGVDATIRDCDITDNRPKTGDIGAGIYMDGGGLTLENTTVTNNWSMQGGAGVYAANAMSAITITDSTIDDNSGQNHPGLWLVSCPDTTTITRTSISRNDCSNTGAGISAEGSPLELYDCNVDDNDGGDASGEHGAGIRMTGTNGAIHAEGGSISGNYSGGHGGGIYMTDSTAPVPLSIENCDLSGNRSNNRGGAIYMTGCTGPSYLTDVNMDGARAQYYGGAIYCESPMTLVDCSLIDVRTTNGASGYSGGALYFSGSGASLSVSDTPITGAYCGGHGGAIYVAGSTEPTPLVVANCDLSGSGSNNTGGAVYVWDCTNMSYLSNVNMDGCTTQFAGGAVNTNSPMTITDCSMDNCRTTHGGSGQGGAVRVTGASSSLSITNVSIANPISGNGGGGGIYVGGSTATSPFTATNVSITNGYSGYGGGIRINALTNPSVLTSVTVDGCSCYGDGGGIRIEGSSVSISDSTITDNWCTHAPEDGGGIFSSSGSSYLTITDTQIDRNESDNGAGLAAYVSTLTVTGGSINDNLSSPSGPGYSGGGVNCSGNATFDSVYIQGNRCGNKGGGVYSGSGSLTMTNCTVTGNSTGTHSNSWGGGIYSVPSASIVNCTLSANFSRQAGGIYGGGGIVVNSIVWGNTASLQYPNASGCTVSYSDVSGTNYTDGGNNVNLAPAFVSTSTAYPSSAGDFHLKSVSPVAGLANAAVAPADDIDGESRPQGSGVDMGSDEILGGSQSGAMKFGPVGGALAIPTDETTHTGPPVIPAPPVTASQVDESGFLLVSSTGAVVQSNAGREAPGSAARDIGRDIGVGRAGEPLGVPEPALPAAALGLTSILALAWKALGRGW